MSISKRLRWTKAIDRGMGTLAAILDAELDTGQHVSMECRQENSPCGKCEECRNADDARKAFEYFVQWMNDKSQGDH